LPATVVTLGVLYSIFTIASAEDCSLLLKTRFKKAIFKPIFIETVNIILDLDCL